ncbi:MAG: HAD family hydrolase [Bryobacteraceae bacterium]|jgi:putative hydrolase of the HAD superfamily
MYRAIIFDLGKVLIDFDFARGYQALEGRCPYSTAEIRRRLASTDLVERFETGLVEPHDFVSQLGNLLSLNIGYTEFCGIWSSIFGPALIPQPMLADLSERYRLVLLSNTNAIHYQALCQRYPLLDYFQHRVLSFEVNAMKPAAKIFQCAIEAAGCPPQQCFYTDDIAAYTEAARNLGIDAVTFESSIQLERQLLLRNILRK